MVVMRSTTMSVMATNISVAGVGAGYFSRFHYESWNRLANTTLVGVCDHDTTKAKAVGVAAFDDLGAMFEATLPDLLDIIVPPAAQKAVIRQALDFGVRWLICQKPFCRNLNEADAMANEAAAAGATLIVHENFRFQPWYQAIKSSIDAGDLGDVHQMTFRLRPGDGQGPRAYLDRQPYFQKMPRFLVHETAVHWIDTFRFLFGDPSAVYADLRRINPVIAGEDAGFVLFDHPDGIRTVFDGNRHLDHRADNCRRTMGEALVEGTRGALSLMGDGAVCFRKNGELASTEILAPDMSQNFGGDCVHALQSHVLAAMRKGTKPQNIATEYMPVLHIEEAIYASAQQGRKVAISGQS